MTELERSTQVILASDAFETLRSGNFWMPSSLPLSLDCPSRPSARPRHLPEARAAASLLCSHGNEFPLDFRKQAGQRHHDLAVQVVCASVVSSIGQIAGPSLQPESTVVETARIQHRQRALFDGLVRAGVYDGRLNGWLQVVEAQNPQAMGCRVVAFRRDRLR